MKRSGLLILVMGLTLFALSLHAQVITEREALTAVSRDNPEKVSAFISQGNDIDGLYGRRQTTLLNHAIRRRSATVTNLLISEGANLDIESQGRTPLINAINRRNLPLVHHLIRSGANIDVQTQNGATALFYASRTGRFRFVKALIEAGADAEIKNHAGQTALDLANLANYREVAEYLVKIIELRHFYATMPIERDGPHIEWISKDMVRMFYLVTDPIKRFPVMHCDYFAVTGDTIELHGFAGDTLSYTLTRQKTVDPWFYEGVEKILALGDVHGEFEAFRDYLVKNGVIDEQNNWTWGNGHLVLLGDIFDRGDNVTETLWLIHQLDHQSRMTGGRVHLLLGNHEIMVMINDVRYVSRKYRLFSNYFSISYSSFFDLNTEFGQWLRKRNTLIKINDHVFSHAGISPTIAETGLSIDRMNFLVRNFLSDHPKAPNEFAKETNQVLGKFGPLWYRGYIYDFPDVALIEDDKVNQILDFLSARKMVIAHSELKRVTRLFDNRVIAIDVPINHKNIISEGLLIENNQHYRLLYNGEKIPLFSELNE